MWRRSLLVLILGVPLAAGPQTTPQGHLEHYVSLGLKNNLALQQQRFSLQHSLQVLNEARGMFLPSVSIQGRYSRAGGGRMIEIPIGSLVNPIHTSLNGLFAFHGIDGRFPADLPDKAVPFLREKEQETKIRVVQPLFQAAIYHNYKLKSSLSKIQEAELAVFKRELVTEIQTAYYNHAKTLSVIELLDKTRDLLEENLRVSRALFQNGKVTEDVIFRAKAELAGLEQKWAEAEKNKILASQYFNFLLNRDLEAEITLEKDSLLLPGETPDLDAAIRHALLHRDEFNQLQNAIEATGHQAGLAKSGYLPSITAVLDLGIQGESYRFGPEDDFWMASLIFEWNLFNGGQTRARKAQAELDRKRLDVHKLELEKQIRLQVQEAYHAMEAARLAVSAASTEERSIERSFEIVIKKYENGMAPQVEYLNARTAYTSAALNSIITRMDYLIRKAEFEKTAALADIDIYED